MALIGAFLRVLEGPTIGAVLLQMFLFLVPVWIAFLVGVVAGWAWKPRWVNSGQAGKVDCSAAVAVCSGLKGQASRQSFDSTPRFSSGAVEDGLNSLRASVPVVQDRYCSSPEIKKEESLHVTEGDLEHLCLLVERKDGGPQWKHMMDRSTPSLTYEAWQRDPETGPPQYCTRTIYEDATPELLRDFFWDDEFRLKWDDMLLHSATMEECPTSGTMVVHWIRKFPFFCSDREYTIGRRIWELGRSYYCVTKGVPCPSVARCDKPRRVDLYYSSWYIQAAASRKGSGQLSACEVIFFHHEDMGIPREIAKFGVRQGMWGTVKKIEHALRAYQKERASGAPLSHSAFLAQVNTKIDPDYLKSIESAEDSSETGVSVPEKPGGLHVPKVLIFGGAIALAFSLDRGLLTKALIFTVAKRFANIGRRL
ncbi:hypothetical protein NMG60_11017919 [Bertholletia excelsa]